jgi:diguanylate cyclase (GGDEF)-like protein
MDFDYTVLTDKVHNIKIYENGFAHLEFGGIPISGIPVDYAPENYLQVSSELVNGMTLTLSASYGDIRQIRYEIVDQILCAGMILAAVFCFITFFLVSKIVKPLRALTDAAKRLADGDYSVAPVRSDTYEIQLLSTAFENMAMYLREHEKHQYILAYTDSMTGLRNTTAYNIWVKDFDEEIRKKNVSFGVIVLDVNDLKKVNDKHGHNAGNKLIVTAARILSNVFKRSPVFRIGGDEFLVILRNKDLEEHKVLCEKLDLACARECIMADKETISISIARGFAEYDSAADEQFADVFNRADDAMYKNKSKMKALQKSK